jgi:glycosyltransferase involved in cell wall biosynthesis
MQVMAGAPAGGAETAFVDMCIAMKEQGVMQVVVTRANDTRVAQLRAAGISTHTLPFGSKHLDIYTPWRLRRIIKDFQPDIVQTWMSRAAQALPKRKKGDTYKIISRLGGYYALKHFPQTDYFIAITPLIRDFLIESGVAPDDVRHINNFAEVETITAPVKKTDLNTPEKAKVALCLSRLHTSKGLDTVISAASSIPDLHIWLAGEGPDERELKQQAAEEGVEDRIHFLGWRTDRAALLQAADICLFVSRYEPFGTVFVQAWAQKTPVIVSDADGPRQFVKDGQDALMVKIDDTKGLEKALTRLIEDKALTDKLVANGFKRYETEFTKAHTVGEYLDWYRTILSRDSAEPTRQAA